MLISVFTTLFYFPSTSASAYSPKILPRDIPVPSGLQGSWSFVGCFTDISTSRTLAAAVDVNYQNMTIESCISFCSSVDYIYAGVEFGGECYCDSTIQIPGTQANESDCNMACGGNASEPCGGGNRLNVFTSGEPGPVLVQSTENGEWVYSGCFTDNQMQRTLTDGINIPNGVTAETCTAACQTAGFTLAGIEDGRECWCDNALSSTSGTQHVGDDDCREVCMSDHTQYCGNANRLAIYTFSNGSGNSTATMCSSTNIANFTLSATYKLPPQDGSATIPLKVVLVEMVPSATWGILSACPLCCTDWPTYSLQNSVFIPHSLSNPAQLMVSTSPGPGESPNFVAANPAFPGFQSYCAVSSSLVSDAPLLSFGGKTDAFSLCPNLTANNRLDIVFSPVTGHPHYNLGDCSAVSIEIVT